MKEGIRNNATSAANQQERLIKTGWVIGFVDGEGCFSIGFIKQPNKGKRKGYRTGYQVYPEFAVTQGEKSLNSLKELKNFFAVGQIIINRRYDNHKEHLYRYVVRKRDDLLKIIIPFFKQYRLQTAKSRDFDTFVRCVNLINQNQHLERGGLIKIAELTQTMNRQKSRHELIRILRD